MILDNYFLEFVEQYPVGQNLFIQYKSRDLDYYQSVIQLPEMGNGIALEEPLKFRVQATLNTVLDDGDFALVIAPSTVNVTVADLDSKQN